MIKGSVLRVLLIALMAVCGNISLFAAIKTGDIVSIRNNNNGLRDKYIAISISNGMKSIVTFDYETTQPLTMNCLWKVKIEGGIYSFQSLADEGSFLGVKIDPNKKSGTLAVAKNGVNFTKEDAESPETNVKNSDNLLVCRMCYIVDKNNTVRIGYADSWNLVDGGTGNRGLYIEKWTQVVENGGLEGKFVDQNGSDLSESPKFGFAASNTQETKTVDFILSRTTAESYYQCLSEIRDAQTARTTGAVNNSPIKLSVNSFTWNSSKNTISKQNCSNYEDPAVTSRNLLEISNIEEVATGNNTLRWRITIKALGSSPMDLMSDGKWMDFTDQIVATHRDADDKKETTYRSEFSVTRKSYHKETLPEFEVSLSSSNVEFSKNGGTSTVDVKVTHQHGEIVRHMYGNVSDDLSDEVPLTTITVLEKDIPATNVFATFTAKSVGDETASDWLGNPTLANGTLTITAPSNTSGTKRDARIVGVFNYPYNNNGEECSHAKTVVINVSQRIKDGKVAFLPNKGHSGEPFGKNPYTGADEQQVHTVERTIYYKASTDIQLLLTERSFRRYTRWYDYQTGCNPPSNRNQSDRTDWKTAPASNYKEINAPTKDSEYGDSYGLYSTDTPNNNIPVLKGWADGQAHIIACDVSAHNDYTIGTDEIIEPTLSYRQLFYLRPATEIAEKFKKLGANEFLENYEYTAPSGRKVMLSTQFRYKSFSQPRNSHSSELCYYYYKNGTDGELGQVGVEKHAEWYKVNANTNTLEKVMNPTYPTFDYLEISGQEANTQVEYQLILEKGGINLRIARFVVKFVDVATHGPVNSIAAFTQAEIAKKYRILEFNDFSYRVAASGTKAGDKDHSVHSNKHLPWGEATYGYYYPTGNCDRQNSGQGNIPYYGEYALLNYMKGGSWGSGEQHGGAANGYALYVDGTTEPGLVASISTTATICSGQTMYCSMWLMNPRTSNDGSAAPIFRCNIQGRHKGDTDWKDVGVYYVGALEVGDQNWKQVVFPVNSSESYDETRVQIYNFGTGGTGNDFLVDDLCLFVSPLSLAAYQATVGCRSYVNIAEASTAVVMRVDYANLNSDLQDRYVYYRIYNNTDKRAVQLKTKDSDGKIVSAYYAEDTKNISSELGSVRMPANNYVPGEGDVIVTQLEGYINDLLNANERKGKCYVKDANNKWHFYVLHIIPNSQDNQYGTDEDVYLVKDKEYLLAIANAPDELSEPLCSSTTELHATTDTYVELYDAEGGVERVDCREGLCANNQYFLGVKVQNTLATGIGGTLETLEAAVHADWLMGEEFDDKYCTPLKMTNEEKAAANKAFEGAYRCTRDALRDAIGCMRQVPRNDSPNPNYRVSDASQLVETSFFDSEKKALIQRLCAEGKLRLYQSSVSFYMGSEQTARYWVYPVAEDATVMFNGQEYTLYDCDEPKWVKLKSNYSEYAINLSPIDKENQTTEQKLDIPSVRILEGTENISIPIKQLIGNAMLNSSLASVNGMISFRYDAVVSGVLEYVAFSDNHIEVVGVPERLEPGEDYLMRMAFYNAAGEAYENDCRVGFAYFYLSVVPKKVTWTGQVSNEWGDDRNWQGVREDGTVIEGYAFAPLPTTNVIIGKDKPVPTVTIENEYPMDVNHHPNTCNKIYFESGAMIHNQHLLEYNQAFVDMKIDAANWNSMAPPLKNMYTGDMYVPHTGFNGAGVGNAEYDEVSDHSEYPFVVNGFTGTRTSKAPYVFWQSLFNKRVSVQHENGNQSHPALTGTAVFVQTNSLDQPLPVGSGYQVLGFGPSHNHSDEIIVRLPKPDTYYSYYYSTGAESNQRVYVEHSGELAFEPDANGNMTITLSNTIASNQFMFGNPTMANIDMDAFLTANSNILAKKYYAMNNSTWEAYTDASPLGTLAPMRSVLLELQEGLSNRTSIDVTLSVSHIVGGAVALTSIAGRKAVASEEEAETQLMTIYAISESGQARCMLASNTYAHDIYNSEEDALLISSGVEEGVNSATATSPINLYTVSEQVPMMVDVRENIDTVPLSMLVHKSYRTEKVKFAFYLSLNWDKECYFHDSFTGERYRIMDGLWLEVDMPENHEPRYFITGPDKASKGDIETSTDNLKADDAACRIWAYAQDNSTLVVASNDIIKAVTVYDLTGKVVASKVIGLQYNSTAVNVPAGVYVVEATMRDNSKQFTQTVVW